MNVKQSIEHLLGGVSKAPAWQRSKYHVEEQINALASTVRGLCKRPPMDLFSTITALEAYTNAAFHTIDRGDGSLFRAVFPGDGTVKVFDEAGTQKTVTNNAGTTYLNPATEPMRALTVGDRTYVLNPEIAVAEGTPSSTRAATLLNETLIWCPGNVQQDPYGVTLVAGDGTVTFDTDGVHATPHAVIQSLKVGLQTADSTDLYTFEQQYSEATLRIARVDGTQFEMHLKDPNGESLVGFKTPLDSPSDLPPDAPDGLIFSVEGDPSTDVDNFTVIRDRSAWKEITTPGEEYALNATTMPHELVYQPATDDFVFQTISWEERPAGDGTTNPPPSVVGEKLNELFFYQGRLGMIAGNNVLLTRAGEPGAVFRETVRAYRDNAPIDIESAMHGSTSFHSALSWNERLYLISPSGQFLLTGDPVVTPRTVGLEAVSSYPTTTAFRPEDSGDRVFLARRADGGTQVSAWTHREQFPAHAVDLTQEVGNYVAGNPVAMAADDSLGFLALSTDDDASVLYVLRYMMDNQGTPSLLNWGKWQLPSGVAVKDLEMVDGTLYMVYTLTTTTKIGSVSVRKALTESVPIAQDLGSDNYDMTVTLTPLYLRDQNGAAETRGRLTVHYLDLAMGQAADVTLTVTPPGRAARSTAYSKASPGTLHAPIRAEGPKTSLSISCTGLNDCAISGLYWEGDYHDHYKPV